MISKLAPSSFNPSALLTTCGYTRDLLMYDYDYSGNGGKLGNSLAWLCLTAAKFLSISFEASRVATQYLRKCSNVEKYGEFVWSLINRLWRNLNFQPKRLPALNGSIEMRFWCN